MSNNYKQFFAAWKQSNIPIERSEFIKLLTGGKKSSLTELTFFELKKITDALNKSNAAQIDPVMDKMRKKIIALYKTKYPNSTPKEAKRWAEHQGTRTVSNTIVCKPFNSYTAYELGKLIDAAEAMLKEENQRISKI